MGSRWYGISGLDSNSMPTWAPITRSASGGGGVVTTDAPVTGRNRLWANKSSWVFRSHSYDPIDPNSATIAGHLKQALQKPGSNNQVILGCNTTNYSINFYYVDATTPRQDIRITDPYGESKIGGPNGYTKLADGTLIIPNVPVPPGAVGADGSDGSAAIFDPINNKQYEFWVLRPDTVRGSPYLMAIQGAHSDVVSTWDARWSPGLGASGSGLSMGQTCLSVDDFVVADSLGYFNRAIYFAVDQAWVNGSFVYPATRTDGWAGAANPYLVEGTRFIFPPDIDLTAYPNMPPFARMFAEGMKRGHPLVLGDRIGGGGGATSLEGASGLVNQFPSIFPDYGSVNRFYAQWWGSRDQWTQFTDFPFEEVVAIDPSVKY